MANKLMAPGPVPIHPLILNKLSEAIIHHRTPEFEIILKQTLTQLKDVFCTDQPVIIIPGTGSAAMEASIVNTMSTDDNVLVIVNGKFGQRWADMARNYSLKVDLLKTEWGQPVEPSELSKVISKKKYQAVFCQAVETSTGTINPIQTIAQIIKKTNTDCLFLVDGITAAGISNINMSIEGVDVFIAGSQKAFMLPTGMSFISLSKFAWEKSKTSNLPKYYFDLTSEALSNKKNQTRFSSLVSHIKALNFTLKEFCGHKRAHRIEYTRACAENFRLAIQALGLNLLSSSPAPSLTAFNVPSQIDGLALRKLIEEKYKVTVMGGQDLLKGKIIRVGHMGYIKKIDYVETIKAIYKALNDLGFKISDNNLNLALSNFNNDNSKDYHDYFDY